MTKIEILHRTTGAVLYTHEGGDGATLRDAVIAAVAADANLADANLAGADLADAYLADAYLARANLARADLADANLAGADLADANLAGADLADADLAGARNVPQLPAAATNPTEPYRRQRKTSAERAAEYRARNPDVPVVEHLDRRILDAVSAPGCALDMGNWHSCETTHCRAGWAIHLAGEAGYELERKLGGPMFAGRAIYRASTGRVPHFFASNEAALEDLRRCAERDDGAGSA